MSIENKNLNNYFEQRFFVVVVSVLMTIVFSKIFKDENKFM